MQSGLYEMINDAISRDIDGELEFNEWGPKFKSYIRKDVHDCFCLSEDTTIKIIFNENNYKEYIKSLPSFINIEGNIYLSRLWNNCKEI